MNSITGTDSVWAAIVIIVIPAAIILAAELDERLRQRESMLRGAVVTLRTVALPFFAVWAILVPVLGVERDASLSRAVASGLVLAFSAAGLAVLGIVVDDLRRRARSDERRSVPELLLALPRIAIIVVTGWILLQSVWGVDLSSALAALGVTSLVVSFALQDTLSGLASGVLLLSDQPFQPGDWVSAGDVEGKVVDINWRTTRIQDRDGDMLIVPNAQLANSIVVNHTSPDPATRMVVEIQVAFKNPPTLVKEMLLDAARGTPGVLEDPPPDVRVVQIDDPLMGYEVHMWVDDYAAGPKAKADFGALVWYQSHRHNVPLPSPAQDLFLHDAATTPGDREFTIADIRGMLQASPLLAELPDADIDRLAVAARPARFAAGERVADSRSPSRDLLVLVEGRALVNLLESGRTAATVADLSEGEVLGLLTADVADGHHLVVSAVTDCEVLLIESDAATEIGSRNAEVASVLNRTASIRRRRVDRIVERRELTTGSPISDEGP